MHLKQGGACQRTGHTRTHPLRVRHRSRSWSGGETGARRETAGEGEGKNVKTFLPPRPTCQSIPSVDARLTLGRLSADTSTTGLWSHLPAVANHSDIWTGDVDVSFHENLLATAHLATQNTNDVDSDSSETSKGISHQQK